MARSVDERHRAELLARVINYICAHGVTRLSLRPLARAVGSSPRVLLYYFGSKEQLIVEALAMVRERQRQVFRELRIQAGKMPTEMCKRCWTIMTAPEVEPVYQLFFEVYALAVRERRRFAGFLKGAVDDWLTFLAVPLEEAGASKALARRYATIVLAGMRGFMLDLVATRDRKRIDPAVDEWLTAITATARSMISQRKTA